MGSNNSREKTSAKTANNNNNNKIKNVHNNNRKNVQTTKENEMIERGILSWSSETVSEWLKLNDFSDHFILLFLKSRIDGECLIECNSELLKTWIRNSDDRSNDDVDDDVIDWELHRLIELRKEKLLSNQIVDLLINNNDDEKTDNHDNDDNDDDDGDDGDDGDDDKFDLKTKEEVNAFIDYYHTFSSNTTKKAAPSLKRDWIRQPKTLRRYYQTKSFLLPIHENEKLQFINSNLRGGDDDDDDEKRNEIIEISDLLFYSFSMSASQDETQSSLFPRSISTKRVNPSSGGLHPLEVYLFLPSRYFPSSFLSSKNCHNDPDFNHATDDNHDHVNDGNRDDDDDDGESWNLFHYFVRDHSLELRSKNIEIKMKNNDHENDNQQQNTQNKSENDRIEAIICLSTIDYREIWKYGVRGWRYTQLDIGHAIASLLLSLYTNEWKIDEIFDSANDLSLSKDALFLNQPKITTNNHKVDFREEEFPVIFIKISKLKSKKINDGTMFHTFTSPSIHKVLRGFADSGEKVIGVPNTIFSREKLALNKGNWKEVRYIRKLCCVPQNPNIQSSPPSSSSPSPSFSSQSTLSSNEKYEMEELKKAIRSRRSAIDFKENTFISIHDFNDLLMHIHPKCNKSLFSIIRKILNNDNNNDNDNNDNDDDDDYILPFNEITIFMFVNGVKGIPNSLYALPLSSSPPPINAEEWQLFEHPEINSFIQLYKMKDEIVANHLIHIFNQSSDKKFDINNNNDDDDHHDDDNNNVRDRLLRGLAYDSSCYQKLAVSGCVTFAFFSNLQKLLTPSSSSSSLSSSSSHCYATAHWSAGFIGHLIYVYSYLLSFECTGMGCFLDDLSLSLFSSFYSEQSDGWKPLYHMAIGHSTSDFRYSPYNYENRDYFSSTNQKNLQINKVTSFLFYFCASCCKRSEE